MPLSDKKFYINSRMINCCKYIELFDGIFSLCFFTLACSIIYMLNFMKIQIELLGGYHLLQGSFSFCFFYKTRFFFRATGV